MRAEMDNVTHCVKVVIVKMCQQGLFLLNTDRDSGGQKVKYSLGENSLVEFNVTDRKHG